MPAKVVGKDQISLARPLDSSKSHRMCMFNTHHMLASIKTTEVDGLVLFTIPELEGAAAALPT
eukprot:2704765-Amphidinium_carterae.1